LSSCRRGAGSSLSSRVALSSLSMWGRLGIVFARVVVVVTRPGRVCRRRLVVVLACPGRIVVVPCRRVVVPCGWSVLVRCVSWWVERNSGRGHSPLCPNKTTNDDMFVVVRRLVATSPMATWHLGLVGISEVNGGEVSCLTSARRRLGPFVGAGRRL
jgi:hypothetical protein